MNPEDVVHSEAMRLLNAGTALAALLGTGTRIWPQVIPKEQPYPAVTLNLGSWSPYVANYPQDSGVCSIQIGVHGKDCTSSSLGSITAAILAIFIDNNEESLVVISNGYRIRFSYVGGEQDLTVQDGVHASRALLYVAQVSRAIGD
jgi:hypothetical protein